MDTETAHQGLIDLSFSMESSVGLWSLIFEGFDQEITLVSKFSGKDVSTVETLYKFGRIVHDRYKGCRVDLKKTGIEIRKLLPENDTEVVNEWTELMTSVREEMSRCLSLPRS